MKLFLVFIFSYSAFAGEYILHVPGKSAGAENCRDTQCFKKVCAESERLFKEKAKEKCDPLGGRVKIGVLPIRPDYALVNSEEHRYSFQCLVASPDRDRVICETELK